MIKTAFYKVFAQNIFFTASKYLTVTAGTPLFGRNTPETCKLLSGTKQSRLTIKSGNSFYYGNLFKIGVINEKINHFFAYPLKFNLFYILFAFKYQIMFMNPVAVN